MRQGGGCTGWGEWPAALPRLSGRRAGVCDSGGRVCWQLPRLHICCLPAFSSQPAHRLEAEQAVKRSTVTGGFRPATSARRVSGLPGGLQCLLCLVVPQILTQDTDSQLSMRVPWNRGEGWKTILGTEVICEGTRAQGLHEGLFQVDPALSHSLLVTNIYSLYHTI